MKKVKSTDIQTECKKCNCMHFCASNDWKCADPYNPKCPNYDHYQEQLKNWEIIEGNKES